LANVGNSLCRLSSLKRIYNSVGPYGGVVASDLDDVAKYCVEFSMSEAAQYKLNPAVHTDDVLRS